jgi:hypothetical protein
MVQSRPAPYIDGIQLFWLISIHLHSLMIIQYRHNHQPVQTRFLNRLHRAHHFQDFTNLTSKFIWIIKILKTGFLLITGSGPLKLKKNFPVIYRSWLVQIIWYWSWLLLHHARQYLYVQDLKRYLIEKSTILWDYPFKGKRSEIREQRIHIKNPGAATRE